MADIPFAQRPKDGVTDRMHQHVGIGVTLQAFGMSDFNPTQYELPPRYKRVDIVPNANVNHGCTINVYES